MSKSNPYFTRKHYVAIARELNEEYREYREDSLPSVVARQTISAVACRLADMFGRDNPPNGSYGFKRERFIDAVETGEGL